MLNSVAVSFAGLSSKRSLVQIPATAEIWLENSASSVPLVNSAILSTMIVHCRSEDETARGGLAAKPVNAEAKKIEFANTSCTYGIACPLVCSASLGCMCMIC